MAAAAEAPALVLGRCGRANGFLLACFLDLFGGREGGDGGCIVNTMGVCIASRLWGSE